ncbi:hypothetical protein [Fredinandcohnia sp. 179-A 10B2 NHS]|uniref:hypothetical protein n=1 Tax=Fredinandcohnia sp. 179-A 10B2 NHS TaxID=3235176 RepID=UPI00399F8F90
MGLTTKHLFPLIRLVNKLKLKEDIKSFYFNKADVTDKTQEEKDRIQQEKGMDFIFSLLEKVPNAEDEFYSFLALYSGKKKEEIVESDLSLPIEILKDIIQDKNFVVFFQQAVK